jgi:hypothetical protein
MYYRKLSKFILKVIEYTATYPALPAFRLSSVALLAPLLDLLAPAALLDEHFDPGTTLVAPPHPRPLLIDPEMLFHWRMHLIFRRILMVNLPDDLLGPGDTLLSNFIP